MAYASGTANDFLDLVAKLRDFLTSNADLVTAGQQWTLVSGPSGVLTFTDQLLLKGPGTAGADEIFVSLEPSVNVGNDYYNLGISGMPSYNPGIPLDDQPNKLAPRYMHLWDDPMPYWFVANGRRFVVVVRVTTVYQSAYAGFILPYHLPTTWGYPMFIGACSSQADWRFSVVNHAAHSAFFNPGCIDSNPQTDDCSAAFYRPDGVWQYLANRYQSSSEQASNTNNVAPWADWWYNNDYREGLDGNYTPVPAELCILEPYPANLGALEGVYFVPGFGTASENTFTVDGVTHLVFQNTYRTANGEYAALALE